MSIKPFIKENLIVLTLFKLHRGTHQKCKVLRKQLVLSLQMAQAIFLNTRFTKTSLEAKFT